LETKRAEGPEGPRHKERWCYSSPLPLLSSHSSYFWPLGMVASSSEEACCANSSLVLPVAPVRLAPAR
jgi:hypothetical protein